MRVLFLGDIVGRPGRQAAASVIRTLRKREGVELVVANCENASHGRGVSPAAAEELRDAGVDVLTSGNHIWADRPILAYLEESNRLLRPLNLAPGVPGRGWTVMEARSGVRLGVVNLIGRVFMPPAECPFRAIDALLPHLQAECDLILVDVHAEATSEKVALAWHLDGRVAAVVGTHTHVQTADESVSSRGTARISDAGMCGPEESILGVRADAVVQRFLTQLPNRFDPAPGPSTVQGVLIDLDPETRRALGIQRIRERLA